MGATVIGCPYFRIKGAKMADLIKIKAGSVGVPTLQDKELAYSKDEKALYIGTGTGNVRLCGAEDVATISKQIEDIMARLTVLETPSE